MKKSIFAAALVLSAGLSTAAAGAQQIQINKENKTIAITTTGQADALADTAIISVGFHNFGKDQDSTYAEAGRTSNAIITALTAAGVPRDGIQSDQQSLNPIAPNDDDNKIRYAQGLRFEFAQAWSVTVPAESAAQTLHLAITAGANNSGNIQWRLQKEDALEADAAKKALEHARQIASQMAAGLGVKLGTLVYASNQTPPRGIFAGMAMGGLQTESADRGITARKVIPLAISPQQITTSATVYAVFAIE
jgi:uncharacterized protein YggE